jgi:paraquat-inducible protein B
MNQQKPVSDPKTHPEASGHLPQAKLKRRPWTFPVLWVVPLAAAVVAGYLVYHRVQQSGPTITIRFKDGMGLRTGQTPVKYRGVTVGEVAGIELSKDQQYVLVEARLQRSAAALARSGAAFWIVRPEVGLGNITGLGTIVSGPYIGVLPGVGAPESKFEGLESSPVALDRKGLKIVLLAAKLGALKPGSPVYYRGVEVGAVQTCQLSTNANTVDIRVFIEQRYTNLVRTGSKFWNVSGVDIKVGLFRGAEVSVESLRSIVAGGIAFATPTDPKEQQPAVDGMAFRLFDDAKKEWLEWAPELLLPPAPP